MVLALILIITGTTVSKYTEAKLPQLTGLYHFNLFMSLNYFDAFYLSRHHSQYETGPANDGRKRIIAPINVIDYRELRITKMDQYLFISGWGWFQTIFMVYTEIEFKLVLKDFLPQTRVFSVVFIV